MVDIGPSYSMSNSSAIPHRNYSTRHSLGMRPNELVARMLQERGLSTYAAAKAMYKASFQPTLHKFLAGDVASPENATAKRITDFLELPLEAVYDTAVATRIARELGFEKGYSTGSYTTVVAAEPVPMDRYKAPKPPKIPASIAARIETLQPAQLSGLLQLITVYLDQVAPTTAAASGKRVAG